MLALIRRRRTLLPKDGDDNFTNSQEFCIPPPISAENLMPQIPPENQRLLTIHLEKQDSGGRWHPRRAIITENHLLLTRDEDFVREMVSGEQIESISGAETNEPRGSISPRTAQYQNAENFVLGKSREEDAQEASRSQDTHYTISKSFARVLGIDPCDGSISRRVPNRVVITVKIKEIDSVVRYNLRCANIEDRTALLEQLHRLRVNYERAQSSGASTIRKLQVR